MLAALEPEARRQMGNLLHQQAREQAKFDRYISTTDLGSLERKQGERRARYSFGAGGGRKRQPIEPPS